MCVLFVKLSLFIDIVTNNVTNNIVALTYFSTLTAYCAVTYVAFKCSTRQEKAGNTQVLERLPCRESPVISKYGKLELGAKNNCSDGTAQKYNALNKDPNNWNHLK